MGAALDPIENGDAAGDSESSESSDVARGSASGVSFARRLGLPQRLRRVAVAGVAVLLALVLLFAANPAVWQQALAVAGFTAPASASAANRYYLAVDVSWADVTLDGHVLRQPRIGSDPPLTLAPGRHRIGWQASPFLPQSCTLSVPRAAADSCLVSDPVDVGPRRGRAHLVALHETLANLPPLGRAIVVATVQNALDAAASIDVVRPGERYVTYAGAVVATQPLRAALRLQLDTGDDSATRCQLTPTSAAPSPCVLGGQDCRQFCSVPFDPQVPGVRRDDTWLVWGLVHETWDYTTLAGQTVALAQPIDSGPAADADHIVRLALQWSHGAWLATPLVTPDTALYTVAADRPAITQDPVCAAALDLLATLRPPDHHTWLRARSGVSSVAGCVLVDGVGTPPPATATPTATFEGDGAYYLERFGLPYALNVAAHRLHPDLPLAGPLQQQAAHLILRGETWPETNP